MRETSLALNHFSFVIGPPVGGFLYGRLGYRAPFVFGEICTILDLAGRLFIIERSDALQWRVDLAALPKGETGEKGHLTNAVHVIDGQFEQKCLSTSPHSPVLNVSSEKPSEGDGEPLPDAEHEETGITLPVKHLSLHIVVIRLMGSSRALTALFVSLVWGCCGFV
jgi:MFS transporter, DHA1 family, solute carrier family 18 (vesicular amine transporter), member 1/2